MSNESEHNQVFDIEIGRNWPEQIIVDHAPYWRAWRKQAPSVMPSVVRIYDLIGRAWIQFANGKNLGPQLMMDWMQFVVGIQSAKSESGKITAQHANKYRAVVRTYLRWLRLMGAIERDPSDCMQRLRQEPAAPKQVYTHEEYLKMVAYGMEHAEHDTHLWLLTLGYHTGMSISDCCNLKWDEVHLPDDGPCFIRRMRRKMVRFGIKSMCTIPIIAGSELWVWFKKLQRRANADRECGEVVEFVHQEASDMPITEGKHASGQMAAFITAALGGEEARKGRSFRNLRNTFASRLINAGTDCVLVAKMTGHQSIQQLADYLVPDQATMQEAVLKGIRFVEGKVVLPAESNDNKALPSGS